jgi:disulfide bond formation protein DsbB
VVVRLPGGPRWREWSDWILALVFLLSAGVAAYHAGAEWKFWPGPTTCSGAGGIGGVDAGDLAALMKGAKIRPPACDEAAWVFAGLSMAGWNALISLGLALLSALAALRERRKP